MSKAKYWSPKKTLVNLFKKKNLSVPDSQISKMKEGSPMARGKSLLKGLGAGSVVVLIIVGVIAILGFVFVVRPAYALLSNVNSLRNDGKDLQKAMANRDLVAFNEVLDRTEKDFEGARSARDSKFGWAKDFPITEEYYADTEHFINAGLHAVSAGRELSITITPFADAVGLRISEEEEVIEEEGLMEAFQAWISVMPQVSENLDGVLDELTLVGEELSTVDASKYPEHFRGTPIRSGIEGAQKSLTRINEYGPDIKLALKLIPELLGVGTGEKRYGIIMQNNAEIRATGGFWTNYATFKVNNALLASDFTSKDMYSIDFVLEPLDAYIDFPDVPIAYGRYLKVERMFARDANISPDFPTAVDQFMYFYNMASEQAPWEVKPVEGFIAIDTVVVKELLEVTGPVTVNGTTFDSENVVLELEKIASLSLQEQAGRKRVLGDLMEGMLINVFESDRNLWPKLIDKGVDLMNRKHIIGYSFYEDAQVLLEKYNYAGRIVDPVEGDYTFLVSTNLGGDKTNLFVSKNVEHSLTQEDGRWVRTVTASFDYNDLGPEYSSLVTVYRDWLRLYAPLGSELISVENSDDDELGNGEERGKTYFSGHITLNPNESKSITFKYYLPDGIVGEEIYSLYIQKQPGTDGEVHTVKVNGKSEEFDLSKDKKVGLRVK